MVELEYYGGNGFEGIEEDGKFEVKASEDREFTQLSEAREYYDSLNEPKALWDQTTPLPELLDCHTLKRNDGIDEISALGF